MENRSKIQPDGTLGKNINDKSNITCNLNNGKNCAELIDINGYCFILNNASNSKDFLMYISNYTIEFLANGINCYHKMENSNNQIGLEIPESKKYIAFININNIAYFEQEIQRIKKDSGTVLAIFLDRLSYEQYGAFDGLKADYQYFAEISEFKVENLIDLEFFDGCKYPAETILELLTESAKTDSLHQYMLGLYYYQGILVEPDFSKALELAQLSAANGNPYGMWLLGCLLVEDYEPENAAMWLEKAISNGFTFAYYVLGMAYLEIEGKENEAFLCFQKHLENFEDPYALYEIGMCYKEGIGTQKDIKKANQFFLQSAKLGCQEAQDELE